MQSDWTIRRYKAEDAAMWDALVDESRQGTMLHYRGYMGYHADRFVDCSLIACRGGKPVAILPANISGNALYSHQGLTYGGWITPVSHFDGNDMLELCTAWIEYCRVNGISTIYYKVVPHIYHRIPAEEDLYAIFRFGAVPWITTLSSTIDMRNIPAMNKLQSRNLKKATAQCPWIKETDDAEYFMAVLRDCLKARHNTQPVHTVSELQLLKNRFPENIRLFICGTGSEVEAEVCIYDTSNVAHCQYIATTETGRQNGTLTYLFRELIFNIFPGRKYFDFGTSNESAGQVLNSGLLHQKFGLGGRGVVYQSFKLNL